MPPATLCRPAHTNSATSALSDDIDASKKRMLEPQYGQKRRGLLREPRHHQNPPAQPETTAESRHEHQDGRRSMAVENLDSAGPPPEHAWGATNLAFRRPRGRTAPTDGITCETGKDHRRTSDRSSTKDPEWHKVTKQRSFNRGARPTRNRQRPKTGDGEKRLLTSNLSREEPLVQKAPPP
jgi:hypothetical protein